MISKYNAYNVQLFKFLKPERYPFFQEEYPTLPKEMVALPEEMGTPPEVKDDEENSSGVLFVMAVFIRPYTQLGIYLTGFHNFSQ